MEENKKSFILEMDEAKAEIIQVINNAIQVHQLPCYIVDMILGEICSQIKEGAKQELGMAKQQFEAQQNTDEGAV
jgi:hypothetical protein